MSVRTTLLLGVIAVAAVLCFRLGAAPVTQSAELRCAGVARHMVESGDYLVPRLDGALRLKKPPGYYWLATASARIAGAYSPGALRAPAALGALGLLLVVFAWGTWIGGPMQGLLAALLLATTRQFYTLGRRGVADVPLVLCSTLALFVFARLEEEGGGRRRVPIFAACLLGALLLKATAVVLVIGVPVVVWLFVRRRWRDAMRPRVVTWLALALVAGFAWHAVVLIGVPGAWEVLRDEALRPLGVAGAEGSARHRESFFYYFKQLPSVMAPTIFLLPLMIVRARKSRWWRERPRARFPALAFSALFVALLVMPMKAHHYTLPLVPLFALVAADAWCDLHRRDPDRWRTVLKLYGRIIAALVAVLGVVCGAYLWYVLAVPVWIAAGGLMLLCGLGWLCWRSAAGGRPVPLAWGYFAALLFCAALYFGSFDVWRRRFKTGTVAEAPGFDAAHWRALFERSPRMRSLFKADGWKDR